MSDNKNSSTDNKKNKLSTMKIAVGIVVAIIVAILVGALVKNAADISKLKTQLDDANQKYSQQVEENTSLKAILESDDKDAYMEQKAREEDYIKSNEIKLHDVGSNQ